MRCTCNEPEAAEGLAQIVPRSPVPIIADIHHQYRMALAALEAGVHGPAPQPGQHPQPGAHQGGGRARPRTAACPIRIGVNGGSLDPGLYDKYGGRVTPEAMVESAQLEMAYFEEVDFDLIKISVKASSVPLMVEAYRQLADVTDHPLHLGVTEAGPPPAGLVKATAGIATLLARGHRRHHPLLAHRRSGRGGPRRAPAARGARAAGAQERRPDRLPVVRPGRDRRHRRRPPGQDAFGERKMPLQVAVMGCVVNGPGEAREADLGIAAGNKRGHLFVKGRNVAVVPEDEMVDALVEWAEFIDEHGVEAAPSPGPTPRWPSAEAERDRRRAARRAGRRRQHAGEQRVELIRKRVGRTWHCRR